VTAPPERPVQPRAGAPVARRAPRDEENRRGNRAASCHRSRPASRLRERTVGARDWFDPRRRRAPTPPPDPLPDPEPDPDPDSDPRLRLRPDRDPGAGCSLPGDLVTKEGSRLSCSSSPSRAGVAPDRVLAML